MKLLLAALAVTFVIAVTASVFAIWPVVGDAPWEESAVTVPTVDRTAEIRCEAALELRNELQVVPMVQSRYNERNRLAEAEVNRYC